MRNDGAMTVEHALRVLRDRWWIIALTAVLSVAITAVLTMQQPKIYVSTATLIIDFKEPINSNSILPANLQADYMATQEGILKSRKVAGRAVDVLGWAEQPEVIERFNEQTGGYGSIRDWLIEGIQGGLRVVTDSEQGRLVKVRYFGENRTTVADIANAFTQAYMDTVLELNVAPARKSAAWIDEQLAELRGKLEQAQKRLVEYQQERGILGTDDRLNLELEQLRALSDQVAAAQSDVESLQSRIDQLEGLGPNDPRLHSLPDVAGNTYVQNLKSDLRRKEGELADISSQVGKNHPTYQRIVAEIRSLRAKLNDEVGNVARGMQSQLAAARARLKSLRAAQDEQKEQLLGVRRTSDDLPALLREVDSAQKNYDEALASFQQYSMQSRVNQTNVTVLTPARIPLEAWGPRSRLNVMMAGFLGFVLGVVIVVVLEIRDRRVRSETDAATIAGVPLIGTIIRS